MEFSLEEFNAIVQKCKNSPVGKKLPGAFYIHQSALNSLAFELQEYEAKARKLAPIESQNATLIKFTFASPKLSYLLYPDFDLDPHPSLQGSWQIDLGTEQVNYLDYRHRQNPPILHRKETFITPDYPLYSLFSQLTCAEEELGLLDNSREIGTRQQWQQRLKSKGVEIRDYMVIPLVKNDEQVTQKSDLSLSELEVEEDEEVFIDRHKAAIVRKSLSRPVRAAIETELLTPEMTFFDYGCGYGGDVDRLLEKGYYGAGWDPYYRRHQSLQPADLVNLGYVINVIENPQERREALIKAWELTKKILLVSAQVLIRDNLDGQLAYGDGIITRRNTFQKYYEQEELKIYIDQVLNVNSVPLGLGIYCIFRDETQGEAFRASRFHSRAKTPRIHVPSKRFEDYETLLTPLMEFITKRGRLPAKGELPQEGEILTEFGTFRRAFKVILQVTDEEEWDAIADQRRQDIQVYLALSNFSDRPQSKDLSSEFKEDIKALFGNYKQACLLADLMLATLRDLQNIADICENSPVGLKIEQSFLVHLSALETLNPLLRLYEGCASRTIGRLDSVNVIKFRLDRPVISYLYYPTFDQEPHPPLKTSMQVDLQDLSNVQYHRYNPKNPPLLHEKNRLVLPDYPDYEKWTRLTQQERDWGLLDDYPAIRSAQGWLKCLEDHYTFIKDYRLYRHQNVDPYKLRVLKAAINSRRRQRKLTQERINLNPDSGGGNDELS